MRIYNLDNICVTAGKKQLLKNVSLQIHKGEKLLVWGLNGSGKTTLLTVLAGLQNSSSGIMEIYDTVFTDDNYELFSKKIGFVSNSFFDKRYGKESVLEIILARINGTMAPHVLPSFETIKQIKNILNQLDILDKLDMPYDSLSKGEQQKVLLTGLFVNRPEILLLDEPTTGLDIEARAYFNELLKEWVKQDELTIVYVTHYLNEIAGKFEQCIILENGAITARGSVDGLLHFGE